MATLDIKGNRLEYTTQGDGDPLVLVHGSASDLRTWQHQSDAFAAEFRTIAYSRRYHWPNEAIPQGATYSMREHVDDLGQVVNSLAGNPVHLIGHSYGGFLCLLFALREPRLVRTLVLSEPPVITLFVKDIPKRMELIRLLFTQPRIAASLVRFGMLGIMPARKAFKRGDREAGIRAYAKGIFGPGGYDRLSGSRKAQVKDNLANVQAELLGPGLLPLDQADLQSLTVPTLLVSGQRSIALFRQLTDHLHALLPQSERVVICEASHLVHEDNPAAFDEAVVSFLSRKGRTNPPGIWSGSEC